MNESREQGPRRRPRAMGRRPRRDVVERLLNGEDAADAADDPRTAGLAELLAAARVLPQGRPQDEADVLEAFRRATAADGRDGEEASAAAAVPVPVPVPSRPRWRTKQRPVRLLVGGALAVFALSGVAIAAQTGALPQPFHSSGGGHPDRPGPASPSPAGTGTAPGSPGTPATGSATGPPGTPTGTDAPHTPGTAPSTARVPADTGTRGLCAAYAKAKREGAAPDSAASARLAQAAGSAAGIDAYCAALTATPAPAPASTAGGGAQSAEPHTAPPTPHTPTAVPRSGAAPTASRRR